MAKSRDPLTADMFAIPAPTQQLPGSLDFSLAIRRLLSDAVKSSPFNAAQIAQRMSETIGTTITEHQLHAWMAPSREAWRFPLEYLPAFEAACETHTISAWLAEVRGGRLLVGREALNADIGRLERVRDEAARQLKDIKKFLVETE